MKTPEPSDDPLLHDILGEAASAEFRDAMLDATLRQARRRRRLRRARPAALAVVAALLLVSPLLVLHRPAPPSPATRPSLAPLAVGPCEIVRTRPQAADRVATRPFFPDQLIASSTLPGLALVRTDPELGRVSLIDDAELLALASPRLAVLVREGPGRQRLVFADESAEP